MLGVALVALSGWLGSWTGTSLCLVRPSACNDEKVVYDIAEAKGGFDVKADKVVNGERQWMGTLSCTGDETRITCAIPKGTFAFVREGDKARGELVLADGTKFRTIEIARAKEAGTPQSAAGTPQSVAGTPQSVAGTP